MKKQKRIAVLINAICLFGVIGLNKNQLFVSLIAFTVIMVLNFANLMDLKKVEQKSDK